MSSIFSRAIKSVFRKKTRTILTVIGISIGVASVIAIGFISTGGTAAVNGEMDSLGLSGLTISAKDSAEVSLKDNELNIISEIKGIEKAAPVMLMTADVSTNTGKEKSFIWGIDSNAKDVASLSLIYGRFINKSDINSHEKVCMVDESYAKKVFKRDNIVGKEIEVLCSGTTSTYTVIGVIKTGSGLLQNMMGSYIPSFIYVPYKTLQDSVGVSNFNQIITKVSENTDTQALSQKIEKALDKANGTKDGYSATNLAHQKEILSNILKLQ